MLPGVDVVAAAAPLAVADSSLGPAVLPRRALMRGPGGPGDSWRSQPDTSLFLLFNIKHFFSISFSYLQIVDSLGLVPHVSSCHHL